MSLFERHPRPWRVEHPAGGWAIVDRYGGLVEFDVDEEAATIVAAAINADKAEALYNRVGRAEVLLRRAVALASDESVRDDINRFLGRIQ